MADVKSEALYNLINEKEKWTAGCGFNRTNAMPLDPKSCFNTKTDLDTFLANSQSTAYPGMVVAVTNCEDAGQGLYVITSTGSELVPVKLGSQNYVESRIEAALADITSAASSATINWLDGNEHKTKVRYTETIGTPAMFVETGELSASDFGKEIEGGETTPSLTNAEEIEVGTAVTSIAANTFENIITLTTLEIPLSVTTIGQNAFNSSNIATVTFDGKLKSQVQGMTNYPWGLPNGCTVRCSDEPITIGA